MRSYRPEELFDDAGRLRPELAALAPAGRPADGREPARQRRAPAARPRPARLPRLRRRRADARRDDAPSRRGCSARFLRDVMAANAGRRNFRLFGPDETASNRLQAVFEATDRAWTGEILPGDDHLAPDGRVMEVLSRAPVPGLARGLPADRPPRPVLCYEAFIHIVDSMFNQHAKWLKVTRGHPVAAADRLAQLPADARTSGARTTTASRTRTRASSTTWSTRRPRSCGSTCRRTRTPCCRWPTTACAAAHYVNVIVAGKQPSAELALDGRGGRHCTRGLGIWEWACNDAGGEPGRGAGLRRRRADARDAGGGRPAAPAPARS